MSFSKNEKKKRSTSTLHQKHSTIERTKTKTKQYKNIKWTILSRLFFILSTHKKKQQR